MHFLTRLLALVYAILASADVGKPKVSYVIDLLWMAIFLAVFLLFIFFSFLKSSKECITFLYRMVQFTGISYF